MKDLTLWNLFRERCEINYVLRKYPSIDVGYRLLLKMRSKIIREKFARYFKYQIGCIVRRQNTCEVPKLSSSEYFFLDYDGDPGFQHSPGELQAIRNYEDLHGLPHSHSEYIPGTYRKRARQLADDLRTKF